MSRSRRTAGPSRFRPSSGRPTGTFQRLLLSTTNSNSAIVWTNPTERAVQKQIRIELHALQLRPHSLSIHFAVEDQSIGRGTLEHEVRLPGLAGSRQCHSHLIGINGSVEASEGVVGALKCHPLRRVKNHAPPPAVVIVEMCGLRLSVDGNRLHIPNAVER